MKTSNMNNILEKYGSISEKKFTMMHGLRQTRNSVVEVAKIQEFYQT